MEQTTTGTTTEQLLTPQQAAALLGCKAQTVLRLAAERRLARVLPTGSPRFTRFRPADVDAFIHRCRQAADTEMALATAEVVSARKGGNVERRRLYVRDETAPAAPSPNGSPIREANGGGAGRTN